jgi:hypothetical protein
MKMKYRPNGMGMRPHFDIIDWKTPGGGDGNAVPPPAPTPQFTGSVETPTAPAATPAPTSEPTPQPRQPKRPIPLSDYTLAVMSEPKPVTSEEALNDSLEGLPWDNQ